MLSLVPYPKHVEMSESLTTCRATLNAASIPGGVADTLITFAKKIHGLEFTATADGAVLAVCDASMPDEAYRLDIRDGKVTLFASDGAGFQNAAVTLIQLLKPAGADFTVPEGFIEDAPDCSYRTVMVDLARDWHPFEFLLDYVDMCRFYKVRTLHLHFTDDQSYTLPSRLFPRLSTPGRSYTEEQIAQLNAYAAKRDVRLMPEIDVPGHCTSFAKGYGDIFGTDGIIRQSDESMAAMEALFRELCGYFPSAECVHVGGDEAAISKWLTDGPTVEAYRARGVDVGMDPEKLQQIMYGDFVARMAGAVLSCGKTPVIWEGFGKGVNDMIPRQAVIVSWENYYQTTPELLEAGFRIVNGSWAPMYIVAPDVHWTPEQVYNWSVYKWQPVHGGSPYIKTGLEIEPTYQVEGGQLLAWGDRIMAAFPNVTDGVICEMRLIEERVGALSENTWNREKVDTYASFASRLADVTALYAGLGTGKHA